MNKEICGEDENKKCDKLINRYILRGRKFVDYACFQYGAYNARDGKYIFVNDSEKVGTVAEEEHIQKLCKELSNSEKDVSGYVEYKEGKNSYISTYYYMADYRKARTHRSKRTEKEAVRFGYMHRMVCIRPLLLR